MKYILHWLFGYNSWICKKLKICWDKKPESLPLPPPPPPEPPKPPEPKINICQYPDPEVHKIIGYVPADLHSAVLPFDDDRFNKERWIEMCDLMAKYCNATRVFLTCLENQWMVKNTLIPFKKENGKWNLLAFGEDMEKLEWRLNEFWKRKITTVICVATGIKGGRFEYSIWNGKNNIHETTTDYNRFFDDPQTIAIFDIVWRNLINRWKDNPYVILEPINEPSATGERLYKWYRARLKTPLPSERFGFEFWDSSCTLRLLEEFNCWMFIHAVNSLDWFKRFHMKGCELQEYFYDIYPRICADSDGGNADYPGSGLKGKDWSDAFRRPSSWDMREGLKYDLSHKGAGWIVMSAAAWLKGGELPDLVEWKEIATNGLSEDRCKELGVTYAKNKEPELENIYKGGK